MRLELEPFIGAGKFRFGMREAEVSGVLQGYGLKWNRVNGEALYPARLSVGNIGVHLGFDDEGILSTIEFSFGSDPWFRGANLIETNYLDFVRLLNNSGGLNWYLTVHGMFCADFGLGFSNDDLFYLEDQGGNEYGGLPRIVWMANRKTVIQDVQGRIDSFQSLIGRLRNGSA